MPKSIKVYFFVKIHIVPPCFQLPQESPLSVPGIRDHSRGQSWCRVRRHLLHAPRAARANRLPDGGTHGPRNGIERLDNALESPLGKTKIRTYVHTNAINNDI